jgi:hypothetical protein
LTGCFKRNHPSQMARVIALLLKKDIPLKGASQGCSIIDQPLVNQQLNNTQLFAHMFVGIYNFLQMRFLVGAHDAGAQHGSFGHSRWQK